MTFEDVVDDIKKMVGMELQSIRPGANITIIEVDEERSCLLLKTVSGVSRSRPLSELQLLWDELNRHSAIHVDEALHGSGTSRNQPETILANLPYIEWLKLDNKKHIAFVGKNTHPFGTLKQMDSIAASNFKYKANSTGTVPKVKIVMVVTDLTSAINSLQSALSGTISTITQGVYLFESTELEATVVSTVSFSLSPGIYPVLTKSTVSGAKMITIHNTNYLAYDDELVKFLIQQ